METYIYHTDNILVTPCVDWPLSVNDIVVIAAGEWCNCLTLTQWNSILSVLHCVNTSVTVMVPTSLG